METDDSPATIRKCAISLTTAGAFTLHGSKTGGFAENVLKHMPHGPWYTMEFDESNIELIIRRASPPWTQNGISL